jgi:hypothetical protein
MYIRPCDSLGIGIEFGVDDFKISIFPTPVDDLLTVKFSEHARHSGFFKCINYLGEDVFIQDYPYMADRIEVNTSALVPGMYFLIFENSAQRTTLKMLVIHR